MSWRLGATGRAEIVDLTRDYTGARTDESGARSPRNVAVLDRTNDWPANGRVLIAEQRTLVALGLQLALSARCWDVETINGSTASEVLAHARRFQPSCALLDVHLGPDVGSGIELIQPLVLTGVTVLMLTAERRRTVLAECVEAGAAGWIGADAALDDVDATIRRVVAGGTGIGRADRAALLEELRRERAGALSVSSCLERLTRREALVLDAMIDGLTAEEIAAAHFVALTTVRSQIRAVLQKLGVRSQLAAVALASGHGNPLDLVRAERDRRRAYVRGQRCDLAFRM